jgi:hypothetical protein
MGSDLESVWCRAEGRDRKTRDMMWIGFSLHKAGTLVGLHGVLSNSTEDSRLLRLHGMSVGKLAATFR